MRMENAHAADLWPQIYRFGRGRGLGHHDSEDLAQGVLLRVWRRGREFEDPAHLRNYAMAAARNAAADLLRRDKKGAPEPIGERECGAPSPSEHLQAAELDGALRARLGGIDPLLSQFFDPDREAPSYALAASANGLREGTLRTAVCRARKRLREGVAGLLAA